MAFGETTVFSQCTRPLSAIFWTYLAYLLALCFLSPLPHFTIAKKVRHCASPANAAKIKAFCKPIPSIQGVIPYPIAKLIVLRIKMTVTMASPPRSLYESTAYDILNWMPIVFVKAMTPIAKTHPNHMTCCAAPTPHSISPPGMSTRDGRNSQSLCSLSRMPPLRRAIARTILSPMTPV